MKMSDIVILTLPLTKETSGLINDQKIEKLKDKCVLINVSRGGVVDESALVDALRYKKFLGVSLDVFEQEPLPERSPLWEYDNVVITPHNSYVSDMVNYKLYELIVKNLRNFPFE
ncbi:NAD(P)-dependent oxidoreductase [Cytobacillus firmus]|nr:NAD(P)-dependent oxidoreductase [Cytobacillus firmus]MED4447573.1 NAD(P)-dependent oxidoreductase [Cytobacillus firmus]MED4769666.1 NAD(P)-dependent oxidoreductase [Cytobacillus firmus]